MRGIAVIFQLARTNAAKLLKSDRPNSKTHQPFYTSIYSFTSFVGAVDGLLSRKVLWVAFSLIFM